MKGESWRVPRVIRRARCQGPRAIGRSHREARGDTAVDGDRRHRDPLRRSGTMSATERPQTSIKRRPAIPWIVPRSLIPSRTRRSGELATVGEWTMLKSVGALMCLAAVCAERRRPWLGWVLHAIGDTFCPQHTIGSLGWSHQPWERFANVRWVDQQVFLEDDVVQHYPNMVSEL